MTDETKLSTEFRFLGITGAVLHIESEECAGYTVTPPTGIKVNGYVPESEYQQLQQKLQAAEKQNDRLERRLKLAVDGNIPLMAKVLVAEKQTAELQQEVERLNDYIARDRDTDRAIHNAKKDGIIP